TVKRILLLWMRHAVRARFKIGRRLIVGRDSREIDPTYYFAGIRVDADDMIRLAKNTRIFGMPDISPNLTIDPFEFVYLHQRPPVFTKNGKGSHGFERIRIHKFKDVRSLIKDKVGAVGGHPPAFTLIIKFLQQFEVLSIENAA